MDPRRAAGLLRARAGEYDEWFLRTGRNDRGPEWNRRWFLELERSAGTPPVRAEGRVLELACGTGLWTVELARHAAGITAVDASPEVLDINRARLQSPSRGARPLRQGRPVRLEPEEAYDVASSASGSRTCLQGASPLSGTSSGRRSARRRAFFVDSCARKHGPKRRAPGGPPGPHDAQTLNDGREFRIVKIFYDPVELERASPTWAGLLGAHDREHLLYGFGEPRRERASLLPRTEFLRLETLSRYVSRSV